MRVRLHELDLVLESDSSRIRDEWERLYAPFLGAQDLEPESPLWQTCIRLRLAPSVPSPPEGEPRYSQPDLAVYQDGGAYLLHLPHLGQLRVDPVAGCASGALIPAAMDVYGAFENINAMALAPLLRRRGGVLVHAFSAAHRGSAVLLAGENASGKTTTGLALLAAGWKLIANDATLLGNRHGRVTAFAFPGLLSAHADALQRIPALQPLLHDPAFSAAAPDRKITFPAQDHFPAPWHWEATIGAVCLLSLNATGGSADHELTRITPAVALGQLLPHSVDRWDQETLDFQIDLLDSLVRQVPVYSLQLGPDVPALPRLLQTLVNDEQQPLTADASWTV